MLPIILALFSGAGRDRSRSQTLAGQRSVGGPSRSEVRSDFNIILRSSKSPLATQASNEPACLASRPRIIRSRTTQHLSYPPALPARSRRRPTFPPACLQAFVQILVKSGIYKGYLYRLLFLTKEERSTV